MSHETWMQSTSHWHISSFAVTSKCEGSHRGRMVKLNIQYYGIWQPGCSFSAVSVRSTILFEAGSRGCIDKNMLKVRCSTDRINQLIGARQQDQTWRLEQVITIKHVHIPPWQSLKFELHMSDCCRKCILFQRITSEFQITLSMPL